MLEDLIEKYTAKADKPVHFSLRLESEWVYADEEFLKEAIGNLVDKVTTKSEMRKVIVIELSYKGFS